MMPDPSLTLLSLQCLARRFPGRLPIESIPAGRPVLLHTPGGDPRSPLQLAEIDRPEGADFFLSVDRGGQFFQLLKQQTVSGTIELELPGIPPELNPLSLVRVGNSRRLILRDGTGMEILTTGIVGHRYKSDFASRLRRLPNSLKPVFLGRLRDDHESLQGQFVLIAELRFPTDPTAKKPARGWEMNHLQVFIGRPGQMRHILTSRVTWDSQNGRIEIESSEGDFILPAEKSPDSPVFLPGGEAKRVPIESMTVSDETLEPLGVNLEERDPVHSPTRGIRAHFSWPVPILSWPEVHRRLSVLRAFALPDFSLLLLPVEGLLIQGRADFTFHVSDIVGLAMTRGALYFRCFEDENEPACWSLQANGTLERVSLESISPEASADLIPPNRPKEIDLH